MKTKSKFLAILLLSLALVACGGALMPLLITTQPQQRQQLTRLKQQNKRFPMVANKCVC